MCVGRLMCRVNELCSSCPYSVSLFADVFWLIGHFRCKSLHLVGFWFYTWEPGHLTFTQKVKPSNWPQ